PKQLADGTVPCQGNRPRSKIATPMTHGVVQFGKDTVRHRSVEREAVYLASRPVMQMGGDQPGDPRYEIAALICGLVDTLPDVEAVSASRTTEWKVRGFGVSDAGRAWSRITPADMNVPAPLGNRLCCDGAERWFSDKVTDSQPPDRPRHVGVPRLQLAARVACQVAVKCQCSLLFFMPLLT